MRKNYKAAQVAAQALPTFEDVKHAMLYAYQRFQALEHSAVVVTEPEHVYPGSAERRQEIEALIDTELAKPNGMNILQAQTAIEALKEGGTLTTDYMYALQYLTWCSICMTPGRAIQPTFPEYSGTPERQRDIEAFVDAELKKGY